MSNPFLTPGTPTVRLERQRRERFRIGVYVTLAGFGVFLVGMLFQGCKQEPATVDSTPKDQSVDAVSNIVATTELLGTNTTAANSNQAGPLASAALTQQVSESAATNPPAKIPPVVVQEPVAPAAPAKGTYTVKRGDTLTRIAKSHHTSIAAIKTANALNSDRIIAGTRLKLPSTDSSLTTAGRN